MQSAAAALKQAADGFDFRYLQKILSREGFEKTNNDRVNGMARRGARRSFLLPNVWKIRAHQDQVPRMERRNVVTNQAITAAFDDQRNLILRMKMPGGIITVAMDNFAMKGFPLRLWRFLKNRPHGRSLYGLRRKFDNNLLRHHKSIRICEKR
jgi:hypothetical protein